MEAIAILVIPNLWLCPWSLPHRHSFPKPSGHPCATAQAAPAQGLGESSVSSVIFPDVCHTWCRAGAGQMLVHSLSQCRVCDSGLWRETRSKTPSVLMRV